MAHLATMKVGTPSLLDDEDDVKNPVEHVSKSTKLGLEGRRCRKEAKNELILVRKTQKIRW